MSTVRPSPADTDDGAGVVDLASESGDSLEAEPEPATLTRWGRFSDAKLEERFCAHQLGALTSTFLRLVCCMAVANLILLTAALITRGRLTPINLVPNLAVFAWAVVVGCTAYRAPRSRALKQLASARARLALLELMCASLLVTFILRLTTFSFGRASIVFPPSAAEQAFESGPAAGDADRPTEQLGSHLMRVWAFVIVGALHTPLHAETMLSVAMAGLLAILCAHRVRPITLSYQGRTGDVAACALLATLLALGVLWRSRTDRHVWHFRRAVMEAARNWRDAERAQLDARARATRAEAAKHARSRLMRMVMHDLRSPLLSVANSAHVLAELPPETALAEPSAAACVRACGVCAALMETIVSDLLDFERIDSGRLNLVLEPFSLAGLVRVACETFAGLAAQRSVRLVAEPLPPLALEASCVGDVHRLQQCLNNGLSNALKFTPDGGVIGVGCAVERAAPQPDGADAWAVRISVRDSGAGMSAQELQLLLHGDSFTQVGQGQLQGSAGTGLGLTIVKHILQLHGPGCSLQIASAGHGHGTTFTLHLLLPAHTAAADGQARRAADADAGAARGTPTPSAPLRFPPDFRVLYVEDDALLRKSVHLRVFAKLGAPYDVATDGAQALEMATSAGTDRYAGRYAGRYAVVVLDNQMPIMGGDAAARELRARGYGGVIIGMTGDPTGSPERARFEGAGLSECVDKDSAGIDRLRRLLQSYALGAELGAEPGGGGAAAAAAAGGGAEEDQPTAKPEPAVARARRSNDSEESHRLTRLTAAYEAVANTATHV